jgi:hypothetical protein
MKKLLIILLLFKSATTNAQITSPNGFFSGCQPSSFTLVGPSGYNRYEWSNGSTTQQIEYYMVNQDGAFLDTSIVGLTCYDANNVAYIQQPVVLRSIREPQLLDVFNGKYSYSLNDSIKSTLVLPYLNQQPIYVFNFIQTDARGRGSNVVSRYISNTRWCKLSNVTPQLKSGKFYYVTVHARIDGINYCKGNFGIIGIGINLNKNNNPVDPNNNPSELTAGSNTIEVSTFPNPSYKDCRIVVDSDDKSPMDISIYNIAGQLIYQQQFVNFPVNEEVSNYLDNAGVYKMVINQNSKIKTSTIERL